jgi:hypothetical protein
MHVLPNDTSCGTETRDIVLTSELGRLRITETPLGYEVMLLPETGRRIQALAAVGNACNSLTLKAVDL